jgi:hypothetical protein
LSLYNSQSAGWEPTADRLIRGGEASSIPIHYRFGKLNLREHYEKTPDWRPLLPQCMNTNVESALVHVAVPKPQPGHVSFLGILEFLIKI